MKLATYIFTLIVSATIVTQPAEAHHPNGYLPKGEWKLVFSEEFDGSTESLDERWDFQNGTGKNIISSRWRENVITDNGLAKLLVKKENRGGKEWTTANMWTKETFKYGYFECRYRYAKGTGLNNSFWLGTKKRVVGPRTGSAEGEFEIDINEGHYPNIINMSGHFGFGKDKTYPTRKILAEDDLSKEFVTIGLEWNENELVWYMNGKEIRRTGNNQYFNKEAVILLSLAALKSNWAGKITDESIGSSMDVDYVRVYKPVKPVNN